jgi:hypothetical protein
MEIRDIYEENATPVAGVTSDVLIYIPKKYLPSSR